MNDRTTETLFERIYHATYRDASAYVIARVRDPEKAKDILQNSYLSFWRQLKKGRRFPAEEWAPYLKTIAKHEAGRQFLSDKKRRALTVSLTDCEELLDVAAPEDIEAEVVDADTLRRMGVFLAEKDVLVRKIFLLVYTVGLTLSQTAEALEVPLHTVRNKLYRTLAELREAFSVT